MGLIDRIWFRAGALPSIIEDEPKVSSGARTDLISEAVERAPQDRRGTTRMSKDDLAAAAKIAKGVRRPAELSAALEQLLNLVARFPREQRLQGYIARLLERFQDVRAAEAWKGIDRRFPESRDAFVRVLRWTIRLEGVDAGRALHAERFPEEPADPESLLLFGRGLLELREFTQAEQTFATISESDQLTQSIGVELAKLYMTMGQPFRAHTIANLARERFGTSNSIEQVLERITQELSSIEQLLPATTRGEGQFKNLVINRAFEVASQGRERHIDSVLPRHVGRLIMITGGLGAGGAERQLTNTAIGLHSASATGKRISERDILGPISVLCRSLHSRDGADFFLGQLRAAGLPVHEYEHMPSYGGRPRFSGVRSIFDLMDHLPVQMREGVLRLTDALRWTAPEIVHIWQDGSVMATGLAAVLAGVPKIVLGVRTMPPKDRFERHKPEYEAVYRSILAAPGVKLVSNSAVSARRYESWLGLHTGSVSVIPNGLVPLKADRSAETARLAAEFLRATAGASFTVGSVMRFDDNKRPLQWLDVAAALHARFPEARFILVGDGPLLHRAMAYAESLKIAHRVLFTGRSPDVGYWLTLFGVFLLLSRQEGLPNVLIEAQFAGVPVVTTPAGGAAETMLDGTTGTVLSSVEELDPTSIADHLIEWRRKRATDPETSQAIARWSTDQFSMERMLERTVECYLD